jgi:hypothetical protein
MKEKQNKKVSPPFEGGVAGILIIRLLHSSVSQPGWLILEEYYKV